jgi:acyl carrier protein
MVAEILHVDDVGRDDDIFDLGADSLDLLELFAALADDLGVAVPQQTVLEAPTVALLAARVEQHAPTAEHLAMLLGDASDAPPLFAVTGRGMPGFSFLPLSRTLSAHGPWPVYAIESFDDGDRGARSLHAIAARRVAGIREVQPNGPYRLGGYSSGGLVALEIGRQLQAAGEAVDLVVLFDSGVPRSRRSAVAYERRWTRTSGPWAGGSLVDGSAGLAISCTSPPASTDSSRRGCRSGGIARRRPVGARART